MNKGENMRLMENITMCLAIGVFLANSMSNAEYPISIHPENWRYFTDDSGKAILFSGSHTWMMKIEDGKIFSYDWNIDKFNKYLDFLQHWNHNFIRLWMWEHDSNMNIWEKTSDGKYDLTKLNQEYFNLVKSYVSSANSRGFYLSVMLFQGWSGCCKQSKPDWCLHPMHKDSNINGIDGDPDGVGFGEKVHTLENPNIVILQENYLRKIIDTLNDFDNIVWEIGNETPGNSIQWKTHIVKFIKNYEATKPKQHLIWDSTGNGVGNDTINVTNADVFGPCAIVNWSSHEEPYFSNPPVPDENAKKPSILDNDHIGNHFLRFSALDQRNWIWKSFTRGHNPLHMDSYDVFWDKEAPKQDHPMSGVATNPHYDPQRKSIGDILQYAKKVDLANMIPVTDSSLCSTTYCLMNIGKEYIIYQPKIDEGILLDLPSGTYKAEIFDTIDSSVSKSAFEWNGGIKIFEKPYHVSEDWVLYIKIN
jgi:hypothetical protein